MKTETIITELRKDDAWYSYRRQIEGKAVVVTKSHELDEGYRLIDVVFKRPVKFDGFTLTEMMLIAKTHERVDMFASIGEILKSQ